jgi:hypothetical protein
MYRLAQDCLRSYGGDICINRIAKVTPTEYAETVVSEL